MANVYEIWNSQLEVHHAVKLLHPNCSEESKQRFQTEIKITAKLHHPNIIEIHGVGEWNGLPLIEMEKIDGYTLENIIYDRGALPLTVATSIGIMIGRALKYAHNQVYVIYGTEYHGVIHRDLKPSNIMVCKDGVVKLMDFGIARPTDASIHTTDGSILGTMQYLSPEQLDGKEPDVRTDVYSLGATLYEVLTGEQAFSERNVSKLMMNKIKNEYKSLDLYNIRIPGKLRKVIQQCMVHDREKRIPNAAGLLGELDKIHRSLTLDTPEQCIKQLISLNTKKTVVTVRKKFPWGAAIAALFVLAAGFSTPIFFKRYKNWRTQQEIARQKETEAQALATRAMALDEYRAEASARQQSDVQPEKPSATNVSATRAVRRERPVVKAKPTPKSFVDKMVETHGTTDLLEILVSEVKQGSYANGVKMFKELPSEQAFSSKALIYNLRALQGLDNTAAIRSFLNKHAVDDAEFYLARGKVAFAQRNNAEAVRMLDRALKSPRQFIASDMLRREVYFYKALCVTRDFDSTPTETMYKQTLDAWWQVKSEMRTSPNHMYNRKALTETQRIAEKYRASKG